MRIAMLVRRFDPAGGGTERDFASAARSLSRAGHDVRIYAARANVTAWEGITVRVLPVPHPGRSLEVIAFGLLAARMGRRDGAQLTISFGRTVDNDLIRCEGGAHAAYLEAARQWERLAARAARAISPYHAAQCRLEAIGFRSSKLRRVLSISRMVGDDLERRFALPDSKVETLYNGVDRALLSKVSDPRLSEEIRRRLAIDPTTRVALFIGNGFGRKGLAQLIEAMAIAGGTACLMVAGEDRAAGHYRKLAERRGLGRRVIFLGKRNDVPDLLAAADIVALPSLFEAFGNVVLEGMAAGLPVLTSARCGAAEILPPQMHPFVVRDPLNPSEIASRLTGLFDASRELGPIARAAAAQFTWERYGARLVEVIEGLEMHRPSPADTSS